MQLCSFGVTVLFTVYYTVMYYFYMYPATTIIVEWHYLIIILGSSLFSVLRLFLYVCVFWGKVHNFCWIILAICGEYCGKKRAKIGVEEKRKNQRKEGRSSDAGRVEWVSLCCDCCCGCCEAIRLKEGGRKAKRSEGKDSTAKECGYTKDVENNIV